MKRVGGNARRGFAKMAAFEALAERVLLGAAHSLVDRAVGGGITNRAADGTSCAVQFRASAAIDADTASGPLAEQGGFGEGEGSSAETGRGFSSPVKNPFNSGAAR